MRLVGSTALFLSGPKVVSEIICTWVCTFTRPRLKGSSQHILLVSTHVIFVHSRLHVVSGVGWACCSSPECVFGSASAPLLYCSDCIICAVCAPGAVREITAEGRCKIYLTCFHVVLLHMSWLQSASGNFLSL